MLAFVLSILHCLFFNERKNVQDSLHFQLIFLCSSSFFYLWIFFSLLFQMSGNNFQIKFTTVLNAMHWEFKHFPCSCWWECIVWLRHRCFLFVYYLRCIIRVHKLTFNFEKCVLYAKRDMRAEKKLCKIIKKPRKKIPELGNFLVGTWDAKCVCKPFISILWLVSLFAIDAVRKNRRENPKCHRFFSDVFFSSSTCTAKRIPKRRKRKKSKKQKKEKAKSDIDHYAPHCWGTLLLAHICLMFLERNKQRD